MPTSTQSPSSVSAGSQCGPGMLSTLSQVGPNRSKPMRPPSLARGARTSRIGKCGPIHFSSARFP